MSDYLRNDYGSLLKIIDTEYPRKDVVGSFAKGTFTLVLAVGSAFAIASSDLDDLKKETVTETKSVFLKKAPLLPLDILTDDEPFAVLAFKRDGFHIEQSPEIARMKILVDVLMSHKGNLLSEAEKDYYKSVIRPFAKLDFKDSMVSYSKLNNIVYTLLTLRNNVELHVTCFVGRKSHDVAFSVYYEEECLLAGAGLSESVAEKATLFANHLDDYVRRVS